MKWASSFTEKPEKVFVCHGEDQVTELFAGRLRDELGYDACAPYSGTEFDLAAGVMTVEAGPVRLEKKAGAAGTAGRKANTVFDRLVAAGQRLMTVIRHNEGGANKDLARFADQINSMCEKWDR